MSTPAHGPQKSLTLQEVYAWLYALQCKRLELRMQAIVQTDLYDQWHLRRCPVCSIKLWRKFVW